MTVTWKKTIFNVKTKLNAVLAGFENAEENDEALVALLTTELEKSREALLHLNIQYKIQKKITKNPLYMSPIKIVLGHREELHLGKDGKHLIVTVKNKAYYIPILNTIKNLFFWTNILYRLL